MSFPGGTPVTGSRSGQGGYPLWVPPARSGKEGAAWWGYSPVQGWGTPPPARSGWRKGVPHDLVNPPPPKPRMRFPLPRDRTADGVLDTLGAGVGIPLAFKQEDFLVVNYFLSIALRACTIWYSQLLKFKCKQITSGPDITMLLRLVLFFTGKYTSYINFIAEFARINIPKWNFSTCQVPMLCTCCPKGRWNVIHSLKASDLISITLFSNAHIAAMGKADENSVT